MKKKMRFVWMILILCFLVSLPLFWRSRPPAPQDLLQSPEKEWQGMISLGVVSTFRSGGASFVSHANRVVQSFEKAHPGVLVSVREMNPTTLAESIKAESLPDILLFGAGAIGDPSALLMPLLGDFDQVDSTFLRAATYQEAVYALPIAVGGYVVIANDALMEKAGAQGALSWEERFSLLGNQGNAMQCAISSYNYPMAGLLGIAGDAALQSPGAFPKNFGMIRREIAWPEFVLDQKYTCFLSTQYEVGRIKTLQAADRAFSWSVLPTECVPYTDQLLLAGIVKTSLTGREDAGHGAERYAAEGELLVAFLSEYARSILPSLGMIAVTKGEPLYSGVQGMEELERSLGGDVIVPNVFTLKDSIKNAGQGLQGAQDFLEGCR